MSQSVITRGLCAAVGLLAASATLASAAVQTTTFSPDNPFDLTIDAAGTRGTNGGQPYTTNVSEYRTTANGFPNAIFAQGSGRITLAPGGAVSATNAPGNPNAYGIFGVPTLNITGGSLNFSRADFATGGSYAGYFFSGGIVRVSSGTVTAGPESFAFLLDGASTYTQTGGSVNAADNFINAGAGSVITLAGGSVGGSLQGLNSINNSTVISGADGTVLNIFGTGFEDFFSPLVSGQSYTVNRATLDRLEGSLLYGGGHAGLLLNFNGTLNYNVGPPPAVPEPTTLAAIIGGVVLLKCRHRSV